MHLKVITTKKGVSRLCMYETVSAKDPETGVRHTTSRLVETFGLLEDLQKEYEDPIAHFKEVCRQRTEERKAKQVRVLTFNANENLNPGEHLLKNLGYLLLKKLYLQLDLPAFWAEYARPLQEDLPMDAICQILTYSCAFDPDSIPSLNHMQDTFFEPLPISRAQMQDAVWGAAFGRKELPKWICSHAEPLYPGALPAVPSKLNSAFSSWDRRRYSLYWDLDELMPQAGLETIRLLAYSLLRLLRSLLGNKYTMAQLAEGLNQFSCCFLAEDVYQLLGYNEVIEDCANFFGLDLSYRYRTEDELRSLLT